MKQLIFLLTITSLPLFAQDNCSPYLPLQEGVMYEVENYNPKDKLESKAATKVIKTEAIDGGIEAVMATEIFDDKGKSINTSTFKVKCINDAFLIDMESLLDPKTMGGYEGMDVEIDADYLVLPTSLSEGQKLEDGKVTATIGNNGVNIMTMTIDIINRKVMGKETITTPAGTFDCYVITYDVQSTMGAMMPIKLNMSAKDWFAKGAGMVRSENYRKDKLQGYSLLTKLEK